MNWMQRLVGALRNPDKRVKVGRLLSSRAEDSARDYQSPGLTPSRLISILREADEGSLAASMALFEEMEEKDAHLFAVANTRRLALTGLEGQVVSAADVHEGVDQGAADEAAAYCRERIARLDSFDEILQHLSLAIGRNIALSEIVWDVEEGAFAPIEVLPIDFARITFDEFDRPRVLTEEEPREGIALPPNKFIVHTPHSVSGHPQRGGVLRVTAMIYLAKNLALKQWMIFAEVFGMPIRIARFDSQATEDEKRELLYMLESLGSAAAGIFSKAVELEVIDSNTNPAGPPFEHLIEFLNREMSKAWLGQTLTTDIAGHKGALAASQIHDLVRSDVLADDIRKEGRTVRRALLAPMTRMRFGDSAPVPHFRRKPHQPRDTTDLANVMDRAVNQLGMQVPADWSHEALGLPMADGKESVLPGQRG